MDPPSLSLITAPAWVCFTATFAPVDRLPLRQEDHRNLIELLQPVREQQWVGLALIGNPSTSFTGPCVAAICVSSLETIKPLPQHYGSSRRQRVAQNCHAGR